MESVFVVVHIVDPDTYPIIGVAPSLADAIRLADRAAMLHCFGWLEDGWSNELINEVYEEEIPELDNGRPETYRYRMTVRSCCLEIEQWDMSL
jgi:hypothetical protein